MIITQKLFLSEIIGAQPVKGRHINMESLYEYGSRAGFWRLHKLFQEKKIPITVFGVGMALEKNPEVCNAIIEAAMRLHLTDGDGLITKISKNLKKKNI